MVNENREAIINLEKLESKLSSILELQQGELEALVILAIFEETVDTVSKSLDKYVEIIKSATNKRLALGT